MPDFPARADGAVPPAGDSALDELLTAAQSPRDAAVELQPVAAVLAALRAGPADGELAGQARALAEFRSTVRVSHPPGRGRAGRPVPFRERLGSKLAIITAATAVAVGGTVAAAYIGALPGPLQRAAHDVFAAPEAGSAHGRPAPDAVRARPLPTPAPSAVAPQSPATTYPGGPYGPAGSARKRYQHMRHGHHKDHRGRQAPHHEGVPGNRHYGGYTARRDDSAMAPQPGSRQSEGPAVRRYDNPMAHHKGSRLQSPLPRAAAFPNPPAGPGRPGAGGR